MAIYIKRKSYRCLENLHAAAMLVGRRMPDIPIFQYNVKKISNVFALQLCFRLFKSLQSW